MAISNLQEKLLFYTTQKSRISTQLSDIQMQQLAATKSQATKNQEYNAQLSALYYDEDYGYGTDEYSEMLLELQSEHEFELATINSWESQLDIEKESLETQLTEIQNYESSWQKLLSTNIKNEFSYGGASSK
jgi:hypothetical protein